MRDRARGVVAWPVGRWTATLAGPELDRAHDAGCVQRVHVWAEYELAPALSSVASHYLRLRAALTTDPDLSPWSKMLANSLVGKLGARDRRWVDDWSDMPGPDWYTWWECRAPGEFVRWRRLAGQDQRQVVEGYAADAVPAMAAWITSLGRMQLLGYVECAGWDHVHYVDTDSLMVTDTGRQRLEAAGHVQHGAPGKLRVQHEYDNVRVHGLRDYEARAALVDVAGRHDLSDVVQPVRASHDTPGPLAGLRQGCAPRAARHSGGGARSGVYRHGVRQPSGVVTPYHVWEE